MPVGGSGAWPGFETTRRAEGSRRGRLAGGPPPTGAQSSPARNNSARAAAPVTGRCTRYGALHPLRAAAPDQKGCTAYGSGAAPRITRTNAESVRRGPGCGARGRRQGLAGQRVDAPSRRLAARTTRGRAAAHGRVKQPGPQPQLSTQRSADTPRRAVAAIRDGDAGGGQPVA